MQSQKARAMTLRSPVLKNNAKSGEHTKHNSPILNNARTDNATEMQISIAEALPGMKNNLNMSWLPQTPKSEVNMNALSLNQQNDYLQLAVNAVQSQQKENKEKLQFDEQSQ